MFASCPQEFKGCTENETISVPADGGSVSFNATVTHIHGGNCGYLQNIEFVKLRKLNETTRTFELLFICKFMDGGPCRPINFNLNLSRERSGFEFILTLFNVMADSIGTYEVIVEKKHPRDDSIEKLCKTLLVGK